MDDLIQISYLNDFIFCPASIYFHNLYRGRDFMLYKKTDQINGTNAHKAIDTKCYSSKKSIITAIDIYSEKYNLIGKIDLLDEEKKILIERKKKIKTAYDGYIFQLYAQYFSLIEMGYEITTIKLYSMDDNKSYIIPLPQNDTQMFQKFEKIVNDIKSFALDNFIQTNKEKCRKCIYEPLCDRGEI